MTLFFFFVSLFALWYDGNGSSHTHTKILIVLKTDEWMDPWECVCIYGRIYVSLDGCDSFLSSLGAATN